MPIKRRIPKSRHSALPPGVLELLLDRPLPPEANPFLPHTARRDWAQWWAELGEEALQRWTRRAPGTRPRFWWRFISTEPRRMLSNGARQMESQAAYLRRMELLLPGEERRLRESDFAPVAVREDAFGELHPDDGAG